MAQVSLAQNIQSEKLGDVASAKSGTLKTETQEHSVTVLESESVSEAVSKFLQEANQKEPIEESLQNRVITHIPPETEIESEIHDLLKALADPENKAEESPFGEPSQNGIQGKQKGLETKQESHLTRSQERESSHSTSANAKPKSEPVYKNLFSLARSFSTSLSEAKQKKATEQKTESKSRTLEHKESFSSITSTTTSRTEQQTQENRYDREGNGKQDKGGQQDQEKKGDKENKEGFSQHQGEQQKQHHSKGEKSQKIISINNIQAARDKGKEKQRVSSPQANTQGSSGDTNQRPLESIENIFIRFMALMARILGQAEMEAHQLYTKIKERTDNIDALTLLLSKINNEKGAIDWTNNEEMKKLVDKARAIGVDIPEGKYKWTEDEKKLFKENIQMRKDSMEKITQLERTDMQRYLQEASQCHQARSNVLKLLKEVIDTIIHNMRGS